MAEESGEEDRPRGPNTAEMTKTLLDGLLGYVTGPRDSLEDTMESLTGRLDGTTATTTTPTGVAAAMKKGMGGARRDVGRTTGAFASLNPELFQFQNLQTAVGSDLHMLQHLMPPPPSREPRETAEGQSTEEQILRAFPIIAASQSGGRRGTVTNLPMPLPEFTTSPEFSEGSTVVMASALADLQQRLHVYEAASILVEQRSSSQAQTIDVLQKIIRGMVAQWRDLVTRMQNAVADHDGAIHRLTQKVTEAEGRAAEAMSLAKKSSEEVVDLRESLVQLVRVVEGQEAARQRLEGAVLGGGADPEAPKNEPTNPVASDATE